jgi:hypothetical protein
MASNSFSPTVHERDFTGDVAMLQGTSVLASARVTSEEAEIFHVPATELRRALAEIPDVSKTIVDAVIMRRRRIIRDREFAGMRVVAQRDERLGHKLDDFLDKNRIPHRLVIFESEQGKALSERFHLTIRDLPVLITPAGRPLRQPSLREVAQEAGLLRPLATGNENEILSDLTIVGAGTGWAGRGCLCRIRWIEHGRFGKLCSRRTSWFLFANRKLLWVPNRRKWGLFDLARSSSGISIRREIFDTRSGPLIAIRWQRRIPRLSRH